MTFQTFPITVAGPSYQSRSRPLSSQATVNFYQQFDESGKSNYVLHSWPGQDLFGAATGPDRGQHIMDGVRYRVAGPALYEVNEATGAHTSRGTVAGTARCIFANDGENMFIVNDGNVQQYNNVTKALTTVTDPDIVGSIAVTFINSTFVYTKPNLFILSDVGNGSSASGLNAAQAESQPDDLVHAYAFEQRIYMIGLESVEPWWYSGTGSPPVDRIDTQIISVGTAALHSVTNTDSFLYWLGDDRQVYRASGGQAQRITSIAVAHALEGCSDVSDAIGMTLTLEGQNFYILQLPTANKTWVVNEDLGKDGWFELSSGTNRDRYNLSSLSYLNGKHVGAHETNGNLYRLDLDSFTNGSDSMERIRVMSSVHGGLLGAPGKRVQMSRFELILETGVGTISGQGEDPRIMIEASYDGGRSFGPGTWMRIGRLGETNVRAEWWNLNSFYDLIIRITITDPVTCTIQSGAIDLRLAGR